MCLVAFIRCMNIDCFQKTDSCKLDVSRALGLPPQLKRIAFPIPNQVRANRDCLLKLNDSQSHETLRIAIDGLMIPDRYRICPIQIVDERADSR